MRLLPSFMLGSVFCALLTPREVCASDVTLTRTNFIDRFITNVVEVRMPRNIFVNSYETNYVEAYRTNRVNAFQTNYLTRFETNRTTVNKFWTNLVQVLQTNYATIQLTNTLDVNQFRTNYSQVTHTNFQTLYFTNYQDVLVMRSKRVTVPVTTFVQHPSPIAQKVAAVAKSAQTNAPAKPATAQFLPTPPAPILSDDFRIEVYRPSRKTADGHYTIDLKVQPLADAARVTVQQWKVEREDGAVLCFTSDQYFTRELLPGHYRVQVLVRLPKESDVFAARASLTVGPTGVAVDPHHFARR